MRREGPAQGLWTFAAVVEGSSLSAAARRLELTPSGVSKQIARLERRLGVRLLNRTTRRLGLTEAGSALYRGVRPALEACEEAARRVSALQTQLRGPLRITATPGFGRLHLLGAITSFRRDHPEVRIEVDLTERRVDVIEERVDLAIRQGRLPASGLIATRLCTYTLVVCAAPRYLAEAPPPRRWRDLAAHSILLFADAEVAVDRLVATLPDRRSLAAATGVRINDPFALRDLARAGVGITLLPSYLVDEDLASGALVRVLPTLALPEQPVFAVYPDRRYLSPKVRVFLELLRGQLARTIRTPAVVPAARRRGRS
jgi:DNA-binding transcriptional LysR family regulator